MYFLNAGFADASSLYVSVNSNNKYVATASNDGNIKVRSMAQFTDLVGSAPATSNEARPDPVFENPGGDQAGSQVKVKLTTPLKSVKVAPKLESSRIELARQAVNVVGVRSRSKITSLKYGNLKTHWNLLAAIYKNGEAYIVRDPQNSAKCSVRQIFKHSNGLLLDFSWSADDQLLAFCSVNNEVIIYDVVYSRVIANLHLHDDREFNKTSSRNSQTPDADSQSTSSNFTFPSVPVKGISFDKNHGKYLMTLGDDKIVNVLEYQLVPDPEEGRRVDFNVVQRFDHLISSSKLNKATIRKICWSHDDRAVSVPNTSKSKTTIVSLLSNTLPDAGARWKDMLIFTGHGFKCTMTQFAPCCYKKTGDSNELFDYVLATASPDASVAIWKTNEIAPLYVANELSSHQVQDLCWSRDGKLLFVTTSSGDMIIGVFQEGELGEIVPPSQCMLADIEAMSIKNAPQILDTYDRWMRENKDRRPQLKLAPKYRSLPIKDEAGGGGGSETNGQPHLLPSDSRNVTPGTPDINGSSTPANGANTGNGTNGTIGSLRQLVPQKRPSGPVSEFDPPSGSVPRGVLNKMAKLTRPDDPQQQQLQSLQQHSQPSKKRELEPTEFVGSVAINPQTSFSNIRIAVPKVRAHLKHVSPDDSSICLEVRNGNGHESYPTRIALVKHTKDPKDSKELFVDFIPHRVHVITGSKSYWALSTTDGQVIAYTNGGRRVLPTLVLGSPLSFLEMKDQYLLAVTSIGEMHAWNLSEHKALFKPTSLYPLLQPIYRSGAQSDAAAGHNSANGGGAGSGAVANTTTSIDKNGIVLANGELLTRSENLTMCSITAGGLPIVTLSNGNGYLYNGEMGVWSVVSDSWWAFGSQYWDSTRSMNKTDKTEDSSLLNYLETHTNEEIVRKGKAKLFSKISKSMLMKEGFENLEKVISLNHLENKINLYQYLRDFKNFKTYLTIYVKRLGELNLRSRLLEIFQDLFADIDGTICGVQKRLLLKDLILSCSQQREVQRILVQYGESIGLLEDAGALI